MVREYYPYPSILTHTVEEINNSKSFQSIDEIIEAFALK